MNIYSLPERNALKRKGVPVEIVPGKNVNANVNVNVYALARCAGCRFVR